MRRIGFGALVLAVLAVQVWVTLRAQVVLAVEAGVVLLAAAGWALMASAHRRRRALRAAERDRPEVRGTAAPQAAPLAMPLVPSVELGSPTDPAAVLVDHRALVGPAAAGVGPAVAGDRGGGGGAPTAPPTPPPA